MSVETSQTAEGLVVGPPITRTRLSLAGRTKRERIHTTVSFSICVVLMITAAILMSMQFTHSAGLGIGLWMMVIMDVTIMTAVLTAIIVPYLKETRAHD